MTLKSYYVGGAGPYFYDDDVAQIAVGDGDYSDSPLDPWSDDTPVVGNAYNPEDPTTLRGFRTTDPIQQDNPATLPTDTVNLGALTSSVVIPSGIASIDAPNLSAYPTGATGGLLLVVVGTEATLYFWIALGLAANSPYIVAGRIGLWVAIAGKYIYSQ